MSDTRAYHHGDLRNALLSATLILVRERGARGFSVIEAARRAGVSPAAPYRHFADRDAMLAAAAQKGFERLADELSDLPDHESLGGCAAHLAVKYLRFAETNPAEFEVMFASGLDKSKYPDLLQQTVRLQGRLESALLLYDLGSDVAFRAAELWTLAHGIATLATEGALGHVISTDRFEELAISASRAWAAGVVPDVPGGGA